MARTTKSNRVRPEPPTAPEPPPSPTVVRARTIITGMQEWFDGRQCDGTDYRTAEQRAWDGGVLASAELVRRLENYDETIALAVCELLTVKLPAARETKPGPADGSK
jgi:hypothetical protein